MKKTLITAACALVSVGAFGQGLLYMSNNNPINDNTGAPIGSASGTDITVELLEGATASTLAPVTSTDPAPVLSPSRARPLVPLLTTLSKFGARPLAAMPPRKPRLVPSGVNPPSTPTPSVAAALRLPPAR